MLLSRKLTFDCLFTCETQLCFAVGQKLDGEPYDVVYMYW